MAGSVNVNEPFHDWDDDAPEPYPENVDEPGDFVYDPAPLGSADAHRTLSSNDPHRIGLSATDLILQTMPDKSDRNRGGELRGRTAQGPASPKSKSTQGVSQPDLGPCLYFGPTGERCDRRAVIGGFCARHQPKDSDRFGETRPVSLPQISKRAVGAAGILAVLWPVLYDLIRELLRFLR